MSELTIAREQEIKDGYERVQSSLAVVHTVTREAVALGSTLGAHIKEAQKGHKDDFWTWMTSLVPNARKEVVAFAARSYLFKQRNPELEDTSQLTFALCGPTESTREGDAPKAKQSDIAAFTASVMAVTAKINKLKARPVSEWDESVKSTVREQLRPLVEVWEGLR